MIVWLEKVVDFVWIIINQWIPWNVRTLVRDPKFACSLCIVFCRRPYCDRKLRRHNVLQPILLFRHIIIMDKYVYIDMVSSEYHLIVLFFLEVWWARQREVLMNACHSSLRLPLPGILLTHHLSIHYLFFIKQNSWLKRQTGYFIYEVF